MQPLAPVFEDTTFQYRQLARHGNLALFSQTHKKDKCVRYEVIRIQEIPARQWPDGRTTVAHEAYPTARHWGKDGWTCFTLEEARSLLCTLCEEETNAIRV